jgi:hypothetical protein
MVHNIQYSYIKNDTPQINMTEDIPMEFAFDMLDENELLLEVGDGKDLDLDIGVDPWAVQEGNQRAYKKSRNTTALKRPFGDQIVDTLDNTVVEMKGCYDVLCEDYRYYKGQVQSLNGSEVHIHFPKWAVSFDYIGNHNELYIRPFGEKSLTEGLNSISNRSLRIYH